MDERGRLPVSTYPGDTDLYDTRYGHVTLMLVCWANRYWDDDRYHALLSRSAQWVNEYTHGGARTERYSPVVYSGPVPDPHELYYRLPIIYFYGGDRMALERALDEVWSRWQDFASEQGGFTTPFVVFDLMGIPVSQYWP
jgi:hypothetical protein